MAAPSTAATVVCNCDAAESPWEGVENLLQDLEKLLQADAAESAWEFFEGVEKQLQDLVELAAPCPYLQDVNSGSAWPSKQNK